MAASRKSKGLRLFGGVGAGGLLIGLSAATEARHRRSLASDQEWSDLCSPLVGRGAQVTSPDGTLLAAEALGSGDGPTFVLAPGWAEEALVWGPVAHGLVERGFRVVVFDLRGQGASSQAASGQYTLARYGEDLEAVLTFAASLGGGGGDGDDGGGDGGGGEDLIVAGRSLGGMSIAAWASTHRVRSRVRAAALVNTAVAGVLSETRIAPPPVPAAARRWLGQNLILDNPLPRLPAPTPIGRELLRQAWLGPGATEAQVALLQQMRRACRPAVRAAAGRAIAAMDLSWALSSLTVPTLVVAGDHDRLMPQTHSERIAAALPSLADLVVLPGVGHLAPLEAPDRLIEELARLARP